jgi:hypothetical protein
MRLSELNESRWINLLYHGTEHAFDPDHIKSGSHFGTLKTAADRLRRDHPDRPATRYDVVRSDSWIYAFEYDPGGKQIEVPDVFRGGNGPGVGPRNDMIDLMRHFLGRHLITQDQFNHFESLDDDLAVEETHRWLKQRGVSTIKYRNQHEGARHIGDKKVTQISWIVFDPQNLRLVHVFKNPNEINRAR